MKGKHFNCRRQFTSLETLNSLKTLVFFWKNESDFEEGITEENIVEILERRIIRIVGINIEEHWQIHLKIII